MIFPNMDFAALYSAHLDVMLDRLESGLAAADFDGLVIFAGELRRPPRDDTAYPFRVEPHFAAWLPVTRLPGCVLILVPGERPILLYPQDDDFWHAPASDPAGFWIGHFDIRIENAAKRREIPTKSGLRYTAIGESTDTRDHFASLNNEKLLNHLDFYRAVKTPYETACMQRANAIAAVGHRAVQHAVSDGASEFELNQIYCTATQQRETELPYSNVVALNEHAAILHYQHRDTAAPAETRSFLIDAGAQFSGYAADVTRTWSRHGSPFGSLIDSMETLQQTLCMEVKSGVDFIDLNDRAHELLAEVLNEHRIVSCSAQQAYDSGITRTFLPHGLGHLLGLQVHDAGGLQHTAQGELAPAPQAHSSLRLTRTLEPGFTITIEPGIYFIASLLDNVEPAIRKHINWEVIEAFLPCGGIRIEDNLLVDSEQSTNLTRLAFAAMEGDGQVST